MRATRLSHPALAAAAGPLLSDAELGDHRRYAVLLQGAALLSHLAVAGWRLGEGWEGASVDARGVLRGVRAEPGSSPGLLQNSLLELCERLFGEIDGLPGRSARSAARRALGELVDRWRPTIVPLPADDAVRQLLESGRFLWRPAHAAAREALAALHQRGEREDVWVAGPGSFRRAVLAAANGLAPVRRRLASPRARDLWPGGPADPEEGHRGSSRPALAAARRWHAQGRYRTALASLKGQRGTEVRALRIRCLAELGKCDSARRALQRLGADRLPPRELLEVAEAAVRVFANAGDLEGARRWVRRALALDDRRLRPRAELIAAAAAWDRGDLGALQRRLRSARPALGRRELAWRWRHLEALGAISAGDPSRAEEALRRALGNHRRELTRTQASGLWNELAISRALGGNLAGAERALYHCLALCRTIEGPRRESLVLVNLAEIRMRRGELRGVREVFEASARRNLRAGNRRAWAYDQELLARYELAVGCAEAALERADAALVRLSGDGAGWRRAELEAIAARALGWLGRRDEAHERLTRGGAEGATVFEAEERPALWALAGRRPPANGSTASALDGAWCAVLGGRQIDASVWSALAELEPYRQARWSYDVELIAAGLLPPERLRWAATLLRAAGAEPLAERLEDRASEGWGALRRYLEDWSEDEQPRLAEIARLFAAAGCPEARLTWEGAGRVRTLLAGPGGEREMGVRLRGGRLVLRARRIDQRAKALFALTVRDLRARLEDGGAEPGKGPTIIGKSPRLLETLTRADRLAAGEMAVLVLGETGTGKELVARRIHRRSRRGDQPLMAINCAALSRSLLSSELFGHARGAFTGADRDRAGIFEEAAGGTVLLDEIGDLPPDAQGSLLRILQEGECRRVGENRPRKVDVRIIAATHRELADEVRAGRFREDLLFRLQAATIRLPPLRERAGDTLLLAEHFLERLGHRGGLTEAARERLLAHSWPGNVRELRNCLEVGAALAGRGAIRAGHLDLPVEERPEGLYHRRIREVRERLVGEALEAARGNQAAAARQLGITRQAFSYLVRRLDLPRSEGER